MRTYLNKNGEYDYSLHDLESIDDAITAGFEGLEDAEGWQETAESEKHLRLLYAKKCQLLQDYREVLSAPAPRP